MNDEPERAVCKRANRHLNILYAVMAFFILLPLALFWLAG